MRPRSVQPSQRGKVSFNFMLLKCRKLPTQYQAEDEVLCLLSFGPQLRK